MGENAFSVGIQWEYDGNDGQYRVYPYYNDFKEEMLNYKFLLPEHYTEIINKAKQYIQTETAKSIRYHRRSDDRSIPENALICLILYCDYTDLSRDFSMTFRKTNNFEALNHIKKRNAKYYHWSKILIEMIRDYGQCYKAFIGNSNNGELPALHGPFYCGMSVVLNISQFNMFIHCPLSTSKYIEVALKFSGDSGMILELDNSKGSDRYLCGMDCSWISRFREEEERFVYFYNYSSTFTV